MLNQIHIRDLATIEDQHLQLATGSTMITGETGAGKSIFIEAIELALGARGSANIVRPGKERADISLCFDNTQLPKVNEWLKKVDLDQQDKNECIIRRVLTNDGRSRSYINGLPATQQLVRELAENLFHLHGQYEQQVLLQVDSQRDILDRYAEHTPLAQRVKQLAEEWRALEKDIRMRKEQTREKSERRDYLRFQVNELNALHIKPGEWEALEAEHHKLTHSESLLQHIQQLIQLMSEEGQQGILTQLNEARRLLETIQNTDPKTRIWLETINSALIPLTDLEAELSHYLETADLDPERLRLVEQRISELFDIARKHKTTPTELSRILEEFTAELTVLDASDTELDELEERQQAIAISYREQGEKLSKSRAVAATRFAKEITGTIRTLSLPHGEFGVQIEKDNNAFSPTGFEKITFLIKTNPDQPPQAIAKVISGGELSRLSLAIHLALTHQASIPTLIFDEVDTGVGGATAEKIGKLLRKLGDSYQVICITHQAQVAACGHYHLLVEKYFIEKSTHTRLRFLNLGERTDEIARMLGGEKITQKTLDHAKEILAGA